MTNNNPLFQPFKYKSLELKNKIVMAPMTRSFSPNGIPGENVAAYYAKRAADEVGLIITEGTVIDRPYSSNDPNVPHFYGNEELNGWKNVVEKVHDNGGKIAPQLWHMGIVPTMDGKPTNPISEGPSGLLFSDQKVGKTMTEEDIQDTINAFANAAKDAKKLGFDLLEVHGAHGYLIDQFFWDGLNHRTDKWNGATLKERNLFSKEVIKAIRAAVGPDYVIDLRISQWKQQDYKTQMAKTPQELENWLAPLAEAGVDIFHCSQRRFWEPEFENSDLNFAGWVKKVTGQPTISVGSVGLSGDFLAGFAGEKSVPATFDKLNEMLEKGEFDLIAVGRAILANPNWVNNIKNGETAELKGFSRELLGSLV
jgi:2,4-dienoyl-CoA reductase-like NADH-dependent reductase (Old Yellow Enzyme family)